MRSTWRKMFISFWVLGTVLTVGCRHQPLLTRDQAKLIKIDEKRLRNWQGPVQKKLKEGGAGSAMVILTQNPNEAPLIFSSASPLDAAADHPAEVQAGHACIFVSNRTVPVAPQYLNCTVLAQDAKRVKEAADQLKKTQDTLVKTQTNVRLNSELTSLHEQLLKSMEVKDQELEANQPPRLIGTVALQSKWGNQLQEYSDGGMHASNPHVNQEETWHLYQVGSPEENKVALQNWRSKKYLVRRSGYTISSTDVIAAESTWTIIKGPTNGLSQSYAAFQASDGTYLVANKENDNAFGTERGEVWAQSTANGYINLADPNWIGSWQVSSTTDDPPPGNDVGTWIAKQIGQIGKYFAEGNGQANNVGVTSTPAPIACNKLPPVKQSDTVQRVHAECTFHDFHGTYYPQNEPYAARRMECDAQAHISATHHAVQDIVCTVGDNTDECPNVPAPPTQ